jgi:hypothetical protein
MNWSYTEDEVRRWYAGKLEEWDWGQVVCAEDMIVAYLAASGAHIDQLHVFAENGPARAFYERFGFRQVDAWWDGQDQALNLLYRLE